MLTLYDKDIQLHEFFFYYIFIFKGDPRGTKEVAGVPRAAVTEAVRFPVPAGFPTWPLRPLNTERSDAKFPYSLNSSKGSCMQTSSLAKILFRRSTHSGSYTAKKFQYLYLLTSELPDLGLRVIQLLVRTRMFVITTELLISGWHDSPYIIRWKQSDNFFDLIWSNAVGKWQFIHSEYGDYINLHNRSN